MNEPSRQFQSLRLRYTRIAIGVLNCLILVLILNLGLGIGYSILDWSRRQAKGRTADYRRYPTELLDAAYPGWDPEERDRLLWETRTRPFVCSSFTHYLEAPFKGVYVNVHEAGFRWNATQTPWPPPEDSLTVFTFGGSTTFGYGVSDSETIPAHLERILSELLANGRRVHVYNFGQGSFYSSQEMILFSNLLRAGYVPDAAVFIDGWNEWDHPDRPANMGICSRQQQLSSQGMVVNLPVVRLARSLRYRLGFDGREKDDPRDSRQDEAKIEAVVGRWPRTVSQAKAIADEFGVESLFVWQPVPVYRYDLENHIFASALNETQRISIRRGYELMAEVLKPLAKDARILDLSDIQEGDNRSLYIDRVHYNSEFGSEIADRIALQVVPMLTGG